MKKIVGFALQCTILITLGYSFLNSRLLLVADWLSPVLSNKVYSFFTLLFLVLGDPRYFPELIIIWGVSAIVLGIILRKPIVSVLSCISTWIFVISLTGIIAFGMVSEANNNNIFTEGMDPFEALPPFPPGLTVTSLTEAPIIGELIDFSLEMVNTEPERSESSLILEQLGELYMVSLVSKPIIASVFSLLGVFIGRKIEHILDPTITEKRLMLKKKLVKNSALMTLILVLALLAPASAKTPDVYTENLASIVTPDGKAFVAGVFAGTQLEGLDSEVFGYNGFIGCVIASHKDIMQTFYEYMPAEEMDFSEMLGLLPETVLVFLYLDVEQDSALYHSGLVAQELSMAYEMEVSELFCFTQEIDDPEFQQVFTICIYQSPLSHSDFHSRYLTSLQSHSGYIDVIPEDYLLPGESSSSVDGSILFSCFLNPDAVYDFIPIDQAMVPFDLNYELLGIAGFVGYWENFASIIEDSVSIVEFFDLEDEPDPAYSSDFSSLTNIIPDSEGAPVLQLSTYPPLPELVESMTANELGKMGVKMEANIGGASSELTLKNIPLPLDIEIERQVWQTEDNILSIQIGVRNRDTSPAYDIVIDDLMSFEEYKGVESEGNAYHEVHFLGPGETYFFEYNVKVKNQGSYTLEPVYFSYLNGDNRFEAKSKPTSVQLDRPTDFENLGNTVSTIFNMDDDLSEHLPSNVSTGIQLSTYAVILYSVVSSIMGLRKWILS